MQPALFIVKFPLEKEEEGKGGGGGDKHRAMERV